MDSGAIALLVLASTMCVQSLILITNDDERMFELQATPPPVNEREGPDLDFETLTEDASSAPEPGGEEATSTQEWPAHNGRSHDGSSESVEKATPETMESPSRELSSGVDESSFAGSKVGIDGRYAALEDENLLEEEEDGMAAGAVEDHYSEMAGDKESEERSAEVDKGKASFEDSPVERGEDGLGRDLPLHDELTEGTLLEQAVRNTTEGSVPSQDTPQPLEEGTESPPSSPPADEPLPHEEPQGDGFQPEATPTEEDTGPEVSAPEREHGMGEEDLEGKGREDQGGKEEEKGEGEGPEGMADQEAPTPEPDEDVLTFEEFKQQKLQEQEASQRPADAHNGGHSTHLPLSGALNNYASPDCGAKVIAANPEAQNQMAVLIENRDVYMLNPCSAKIWFIVELCELVSVRRLEIACFELFSSNPESFNVYSTDSYPEGEWSHLGTFHVNNDREVQNLPLVNDAEESVYSKYIKVEMLSHYGSEHYCPLSLLRVLGASMMEVYEYSERREQSGRSVILPPSEGEIMDELLTEVGEETVKQNGTLLSAAKDAVLSLLDKPLSLLGKVNGLIKPEAGEGGGGCEGKDTPCPVHQHLQPEGETTSERSEGSVPEIGVQGVAVENLGESSIEIPDSPFSVEDSPGSERPAETTPVPEVEKEDAELDLREAGDKLDQQHSALNSGASPRAEELQPVEPDAGLHGDVGGAPEGGTAESPPTDSIAEEQNGSDSSPKKTEYDPGRSVDGSHSSSFPEPQPTAVASNSSHNSCSTVLPRQPATASEEDGLEGKPLHPEETHSEDSTAEKQDDLHSRFSHDQPSPESPALSLGPDLEQMSDDPSRTTPEQLGKQEAEENGREVSGGPVGGTLPQERGKNQDDEMTVTSAQDIPSLDVYSTATNEGSVIETLTTGSEDSLDSTATAQSFSAAVTANSSSPSPSTPPVSSPSTPPAPSPASPEDTSSYQPSQEPTTADRVLPPELPVGTHSTPTDTKPSLNSNTTTSQQNATSTSHNKTAGDPLLPLGNGLGVAGGGTAQPKEKSVFVRLSNRIRDLEENMSLFSSYLDQISTRLKKNKNRTEDAQKSLDRRVSQLNDSLQTLQHEVEQSLSFLRSLYSELQEVVSLMQHIVVHVEALPNKEISVWHVLLAAAGQALVFLLLFLLLCVWLSHKQSSLSNQLRRDIGRISTSGHVTQTGNHVTNHMGRSELYSANHIAGSISRNELPYTKQDTQQLAESARTMSKLLSNPPHGSLLGSDEDSWQVADSKRRRKKLKNKSL